MELRMEITVLCLILCCQLVLGGHYLFWLPMCSKSVKIGVVDLGLELARRGHEITVVSPFKSKKLPNGVTEIVHKSELDLLVNKVSDDLLTKKGAEPPVGSFIEVSFANNKHALELPEVQQLLEEQHVDVVVTVPVFANELAYYLAHQKNASSVVMNTVPFSTPIQNWDTGDVYNPSYTPFIFTGYSQEMTFPQRFKNTLVTAGIYLAVEFYTRPRVDRLLSETFQKDLQIPKISTLAKKTALHINHGSPFLGDGLRPVMPKTILAGLMTCAPAKPLPETLREFIDTAEHGVIFVSFGSVIKSSKMPEFKRQSLLSVFSKLKQRVIWKWEVDMPDAPPNLLISSWLPQPDLLGHPNVKLFITHGGAGSYQETICHKTPVVGIPIAQDQYINLNEAVKHGMGVVIDWHELTTENLDEAVNEVLNNPVYQENVAKLNSLILDQPQHPMERAVWWMEYLLRHPQNENMQSPALRLYWFQYFLLDVLVVIFLISFVIFFILRFMVCFCWNNWAKKSKSKVE